MCRLSTVISALTGDMNLIEKLMYDNSFPRPSEDLIAKEKCFDPKDDILLIKDNVLREKLLNINLFISKIDSLNDTQSTDLVDHTEETNSDNTTIHAYKSLPECDSFYFDLLDDSSFSLDESDSETFDDEHSHEYVYVDDEPNPRDLTVDVVEDIPDNSARELQVQMPNILPTHPTRYLDFDFIPSHDDIGSDLEVSFPSGNRNKTFDPGIFIKVESKRFRDPLSSMIDTVIPFSSKNDDKVFNHSSLDSKDMKSLHFLSHRGFKAFKLVHHESPMMIHEGNTPNLDVPYLHFYPP
ncbi:hypothetical protein Tco_0928208 [Tanacetum coccineum]